jgi:hypothetical protein
MSEGQIQPPTEIKNNVIDFQKTQENRLVKSTVDSENGTYSAFLKPHPLDTYGNILNDSVKTQGNDKDENKRKNILNLII